MKHLFIIAFLIISVSSFAQKNEKMRERIKAQKIAFITDKLELTPEEAQKFWPIYNAYEAKVDKIKSKDLKAIKMKIHKNTDISDKEADQLLEKLLKSEAEMNATKVKLVKDLRTILSSKKIIQLKSIEHQFHKKLLGRLREIRHKRKEKN